MSPEDPSVSVPVWLIASVIVPISIGILEIIRRLGLRELSRWESRVSDLEAHLDDLQAQMEGEHDGVAEEVGDLKEEIRSLGNEIRR